MKNRFHFAIIALFIFLYACKQRVTTESERMLRAKTPVAVCHVSKGTVSDDLELFGSTFYLKRNVVTASIPAFITTVKIKLGDHVKVGDILYEIESKERRALGGTASKVDTALSNFGFVRIRASASGIISTLDKQQPGDYVLEGTQLCTIAGSSDLAFQVNVPFEYAALAKEGRPCSILLPDNSRHSATFTRSLSAMNALSQTQGILAKPDEVLLLPENMIVKVALSKGGDNSHQVLPKTCVLSDEMLKDFWVMKLNNDTTAVKIPVKTGNQNKQFIEIISPVFSPNDLIVSEGNYGLADTAYVKIEK